MLDRHSCQICYALEIKLLLLLLLEILGEALQQNNNDNNNPKLETGTTCVTCSANICWKPALM